MEVMEDYVPKKKEQPEPVTESKERYLDDKRKIAFTFRMSNGDNINGSAEIPLEAFRAMISESLKKGEFIGVGQSYLLNPKEIVLVQMRELEDDE